MSATGWPAYRALLVQVVRDTPSYRMLLRVTGLLLTGALLVLALTHYWGKPMAGKGLLVLFLWVAVQMWCGAFLKSAVAQNRPEYAGLVPQLRVRLMRLTAGLFIGGPILLGLLAALLFGYPGYVLLVGGLMNVYILFTSRYVWLAFSPALISLILAQSGLADRLALAIDDDIGQAITTVLGSLLLLALGGKGLREVFPQAGDAHWAWFKRYSRNKENPLRSATQIVSTTRFGAWLHGLRSSPYQAALRKDSHSGGTPQRMMMHALGPGAHPAGHIGAAVGVSVLALLLLAAARGNIRSNSFVLLCNVMQWAVLMAGLRYIMGVVDCVARTQTEQAIFFLSAGAPATAKINRLLGGAMLRSFFMVWVTSLLCVTAIDFLVQGQTLVRGPTLMLAVLLLPLACLLPRNYALIQATNKGPAWITLTVLYVIVCNILLSLANARQGVPWFWLSGVVAAISLLELYRRWRKLLALPPVLPAGRLAV